MIDRAKFGEAMAKVLDRLDRMIEAGEISDDFEVDNVLVVAAFIRPDPNRDDVYPDSVEVQILLDGTTVVPYVQEGLLRYAIGLAGAFQPVDGDDAEEDGDDEQ